MKRNRYPKRVCPLCGKRVTTAPHLSDRWPQHFAESPYYEQIGKRAICRKSGTPMVSARARAAKDGAK